jgi:uncharacterized membrane protein
MFFLSIGLNDANAGVQFRAIDVPGAIGTQAISINNNGEVVGLAMLAPFGSNSEIAGAGFTLSSSVYSTNVVNAAHNTIYYGMNDFGVIVGSYEPYKCCSTPRYGFRLEGSSLQSYNVAPNISTTIWGINDSGLMVGDSYIGGCCYRGIIVDSGNVSIFTVPGASNSRIQGVSNSGDYVGTADNDGFFYHNGTYTMLSFPGAKQTVALGVNNTGEVVGQYYDALDLVHGYIYMNGNYTAIDHPLGVNSWMQGINDRGEIVGTYIDSGNMWHGFLIPIPEPSTVPIILTGLGMIFLGRRGLVKKPHPSTCQRQTFKRSEH